MLGEVLRIIRESADLNLTEGADKLGLSKSYVSEIENSKKVPTVETLHRYAEEFDIPVSSIFFFSENYAPNEGELSKKIRRALGRQIVKRLS